MDPRNSAQDILRCDLCETHVVQSHCKLCHINLCTACARGHLSESTKKHRMVPYTGRTSSPNYPKCPKHSKNCKLFCEKCNIPVCSTCNSSGKHNGHNLSDVLQKFNSKAKDIEKDLRELEIVIYPTYKEIATGIKTKQNNLEKHYTKLTTAVTKQGEDWHREINIIVSKQKSEIEKMKFNHLVAVNKQGKEIERIVSDLNESIVDLKKILQSNEIFSTSAYRSRIEKFRHLPPEVAVSFPVFSPYKINTEQLNQMFGYLSALSITTEEPDYIMEKPEAEFRKMFHKSELITTIGTEYHSIYSVRCLSNEEIWTCGNKK